jgi:anaerobic dimethyl sulfoxide reductase subunit A
MLGSFGTPGAGPIMRIGPTRPIPVGMGGSWIGLNRKPGGYQVPTLYRGHSWAEAVLLLDRVRNGQLGEKDYMRMVGWKADASYLEDFNPKLVFAFGGRHPQASDFISTCCDSSNSQVKALQKMDFVVTTHSVMNSSTRYADVILPVRDAMWEEKYVLKSEYGGFESINYCPEVVKPPAEAKSIIWIYIKLAEKLGLNPHEFFSYYTSDENWENDWERYQKDIYQGVVDYYHEKNVNVPSWEEFSRGQFINCEEMDDGPPFVGFEEETKGGKPFKTESGKIEFYSKYVANEANRGIAVHRDTAGRLYGSLPGDWGAMTPYPTFRAMPRGMDDTLAVQYPLFLVSPGSRYRVHYLFWEHDWLRNHVYRHRVWISAADARTRGIGDNDLVTVFNDRGKVVMPAYVTNRMMPGIVLIHGGGKVILSESGIDFGGSASTLLGGDFDSCLTPARATNMVQIEKYI